MNLGLVAFVLSIAVVAPVVASATASEILVAPFTTVGGTETVNSYSGSVDITVSGVGQSGGSDFNDAFYTYIPSPPTDETYYVMTFGLSTIPSATPATDVKNFITGGRPAYDSSHVYTFVLNTSAVSPTQLWFGVNDGQFNDNTGAFTISIAQVPPAGPVPEPAAWAMMLTGLLGVGGIMRSRRNRGLAAT